MSIGERLRSLRYSEKNTLRQQGNLFGVSTNSVYRWEHDLNIPRLPVLKEISEHYNVSMEWLLSGDKEVAVSEQRLDINVEQQFINIFRQLPDNCKYKVFGYVESLYSELMDKKQAEEKLFAFGNRRAY